jgi:signal transduction histidine kinase/ligand-binding sensor domain-containing protein
MALRVHWWLRWPAACLVCALLGPTAASGQVLPFSYYTPEREVNPLPSAEVHRIHQDRTGVVWIAVYSSGLVRYDGASMQVLTTDEGLRDLHLWDIVEDAHGHLWIASNAGIVVSDRAVQGLAPGDSLRFVSAVGATELLDVAIRMNNLATSTDGSVWVGTDTDGLVRYRWNEATLTADTLLFEDSRGGAVSVQSVVQRADGTLWVALGDQRLVVLDGNGQVTSQYGRDDGMPSADLNLLYEDPQGRLYAGSAEGAVHVVESGGGLRQIVAPMGSNVSSILRDARGQLWVGTQGGGLVERADTSPRILTRENGLLSESVHHIWEDHERNIWISQTGGLVRLRANYAAFENFTARSYRGEQPVLPAGAVNAVRASETGPCRVWAATAEAGLACIGADGAATYVQEVDGLQNNWVNALDEAGNGAVWAGTLRGISRVAPSRSDLPGAMRVESFGGASILAIRRLGHPTGEGTDGKVDIHWFPAFQSVYANIAGAWYIFRDASGLPSAVYQSVEMAPDGHLILGTRDRGLYRSTRPLTVSSLASMERTTSALSRSGAGSRGFEITQTVFEPLEVAGGLPSPQIEYIQRIGTDLWIATPSGLAVVDGLTNTLVETFDRRRGMPADNVISVAFDEDRRTLWAGTNRGLVAIDVDVREVSRTITQQDGLVNNEGWFLGSVALDGRGGVLYGTANGLTRYRPAFDIPLLEPPRVLIRKVALVSGAGRSNEVVFEYSALTFADEKRTQYRTRLAGYEDEWSEPTSDTRLRYTNLPALLRPRTYTLEVIAANASGVWSDVPASYRFEIRPPWWLTWWAFALYAVAVGVTAVIAHTIQHGRVVRREREKARLREAELRAETAHANTEAAEARSRALMAENERKAVELQKARELESAYYDLKSAQARLVQAEKMASLGRLAAGIAHEIKNPLNFVNNFAALSGELVEELREVLRGAEVSTNGPVREELDMILSDLELNTTKIREHGKRTDEIVRSMLMHSRGTGTEAMPVRINDFVEEYLNLAYHGMRAEHSDFNTALEREFDPTNPEVTLAPQEIGRVLINLLNNAFYAVHERQRVTPGYQPEVRVTTRAHADTIEIRVRDNGPGIPAHIRERIFEPFFTTKPTGAGTGLGLSLSYDIVTQGHGGRLRVDSRQGDFTEFVVALPVTSPSNNAVDATAARVSDEEPTIP